jgi:hypothetical protein
VTVQHVFLLYVSFSVLSFMEVCTGPSSGALRQRQLAGRLALAHRGPGPFPRLVVLPPGPPLRIFGPKSGGGRTGAGLASGGEAGGAAARRQPPCRLYSTCLGGMEVDWLFCPVMRMPGQRVPTFVRCRPSLWNMLRNK